MKYTKYTALYASITLVLILAVAPLTSYAMLDIYRNIETGFIELAQSIRVTGNAIITGNLGIGTTSPGKQVDIYKNTNPELRLNSLSDGSVTVSQTPTGASVLTSSTGTGGNLILGTAGLEKARIDTNGNLGIATQSPTEKLEVNGNIRLSGSTPNYRVSNLADPIDNADAANKRYVDARVSANGGGGGSISGGSQYLSDGSYYSEGGAPYFCRLNVLSGTTQQIISVNQNKKCDTANDLYCNGGSCTATVAVVDDLKQNGQLVAAAGEKSCAINNGQVYCWGYMGQGQKWVAIEGDGYSSGYAFTCALSETGKVYCWGYNGQGQLGNGTYTNSNVPVAVSGINNATDIQVRPIGTGAGFACALLSNGQIKCWGYNLDGQLGNGTYTTSNVPVIVSGITNATSISLGQSHACALLSSDQVKCWGNNGTGQLGNGTYANSQLPVSVSSLSSITQISTSYNPATASSYAVTSTGAIFSWGHNGQGQLGNGTYTTSNVPVSVSGISNAISVLSSSSQFACALLSSGQVKCWGTNASGQLGNGTTTNTNTPVIAIGIADAVDISLTKSASYPEVCALLSSGGVSCWGNSHSSTPLAIADVSNAIQISVGSSYAQACALLSNGQVKCWGYNAQGQLGNGTTTSEYNKGVLVSGITNATSVSVSNSVDYTYAFSCAGLADGQIKCWGYNGNGQLGNGTATAAMVPVIVSNTGSIYYSGIGSTSIDKIFPEKKDGINAATSVATGPYHTCTIESGIVYCWGFNSDGQLGNGGTTNTQTPSTVVTIGSATQIAVGNAHSCAILADKTVRCWGANQFGQLGNGSYTSSNIPISVTGITDAVRISAGNRHTCVTLTSGAVKCWGTNDRGQLGNGGFGASNIPVTVSGVSSATEIASGDNHSCVVTSTNGVQCWGEGQWGQLGNGYAMVAKTAVTVPGITNARKIGAGTNHTCATLTDYKVKCWGLNGTWQQASTGYFSTSTPQSVLSMQNAFAIAGGSMHSCVVANDSLQASCFGGNRNGQLGNGTSTPLVSSSSIVYESSLIDTSATEYSVALCETREIYNGNLGGIDGANAICKTQCGTGYKFIREAELSNFTASVTTGGKYWVDSITRGANTCTDWTSDSSGVNGYPYIFSTYGYTSTIYSQAATTCNTQLPLLCVRGVR